MKFCVSLFLSLPLYGAFCGCGGTSVQQYFPLKEGAKWNYSLELLMPFGNVVKGELVSRIDGMEEVGGKDYYKLVSVSSGIPGAEPEYQFMRVDDKGVYAIDSKNRDFGEYLVAPVPFQAGGSWEVVSSKGKQTCTLESFEPAEMIEEKFDNCARISCKGELSEDGRSMDVESTTHRCPGIGLVKENSKFTVDFNSISATQALTKYEG